MQSRIMIFLGIVVVCAFFIIGTALVKRPSVVEVTARIQAQKDIRDKYTNGAFKQFAFRGEITEIEDYVVRVPLREMRYKVFFKPEGSITRPSGSPDTTYVYNFSDAAKPYVTFGHGQDDFLDEEYTLIKKAGQPYFLIKDDDGEVDTVRVSFRLFPPPDDLSTYIDSVQYAVGDQLEY
ncbi:MAG: hypothetical protein AAF804_06720 [Bacteroidota bacterium]